MKTFARINLSSVLSSVALAKGEALAKVDALRRGILVSSLAREWRGKCCQCESVANTNSNCQWTALVVTQK